MTPRLTIAVVNYNSGHRLAACIASVARHAPTVPYECIVVDNASTDGSADFLRGGTPPHVRLVQSPANLLWTAAVNLCFLQARSEYVLIMNADIQALPGSFDALVRLLDADPTVGAVGGNLVTPGGAQQRYFSRFVTPLQLVRLNYLHPDPSGTGRLRRWYAMADADFSRPVEAPRPAGGCLAVRRGLLPPIPLSRDLGLYWSDYELAHLVWDGGHRILVDPAIRFVHDDQAGRTPTGRPRLQDVDYLVGAVRYFRRCHGRWAGLQARVLLGGAVLATLLVKHVPRLLLRREPAQVHRERWRALGLFLRGRNMLLEEARRQALQAGFLAQHPVL